METELHQPLYLSPSPLIPTQISQTLAQPVVRPDDQRSPEPADHIPHAEKVAAGIEEIDALLPRPPT